jgi:hypothetical protein
MANPFEQLSDEDIQARIDAAKAKMKDAELEDIVKGNQLPADLPQPDPYGPKPPEEIIYHPEEWEE